MIKYNYAKNTRIIKKSKNKAVLFLMDTCMSSTLQKQIYTVFILENNIFFIYDTIFKTVFLYFKNNHPIIILISKAQITTHCKCSWFWLLRLKGHWHSKYMRYSLSKEIEIKSVFNIGKTYSFPTKLSHHVKQVWEWRFSWHPW